MLDFFLMNGFSKISAHDLSSREELKDNFIKNHPGFSRSVAEKYFRKISSLKKTAFYLKDDYLKEIERADLVFAPQSWFLYKENKPLLKLQRKIPVLNIINLYFSFGFKIIGVTGSQGKTTTSRLIHHLFLVANKNIYYGGNDKKSVQSLPFLTKVSPDNFLLLEISHRQLRFLKNQKGPYISVILNISRNHLDEVRNFKEYQGLKKRILLSQGKKDFAVLNFDDQLVKKFSRVTKSQVFFFSSTVPQERGAFLDRKDGFLKIKIKGREINIVGIKELSLQAQHHLQDVLAAAAVGFLSKISLSNIKKAIKTFVWPSDCFECLGKFKGVEYYSNLASATPEAAKLAVENLTSKKYTGKRIFLLTGGEDKKMDYRGLIDAIKRGVDFLVLFPDSVSRKIKLKINRGKSSLIVKTVESLKEAAAFLKSKTKRGDTVLLSPGGAFFKSKYGSRKVFLKMIEQK